jgi:hypothetical protein
MKSIHFNQVPDMKGKKSMPFTDVVAFNAKEKLNEEFELKLVKEEVKELGINRSRTNKSR